MKHDEQFSTMMEPILDSDKRSDPKANEFSYGGKVSTVYISVKAYNAIKRKLECETIKLSILQPILRKYERIFINIITAILQFDSEWANQHRENLLAETEYLEELLSKAAISLSVDFAVAKNNLLARKDETEKALKILRNGSLGVAGLGLAAGTGCAIAGAVLHPPALFIGAGAAFGVAGVGGVAAVASDVKLKKIEEDSEQKPMPRP